MFKIKLNFIFRMFFVVNYLLISKMDAKFLTGGFMRIGNILKGGVGGGGYGLGDGGELGVIFHGLSLGMEMLSIEQKNVSGEVAKSVAQVMQNFICYHADMLSALGKIASGFKQLSFLTNPIVSYSIMALPLLSQLGLPMALESLGFSDKVKERVLAVSFKLNFALHTLAKVINTIALTVIVANANFVLGIAVGVVFGAMTIAVMSRPAEKTDYAYVL